MRFQSEQGRPIILSSDETGGDEHVAQAESAMNLFWMHAEYVGYFMQRAEELGLSGRDIVVILADVDDLAGGDAADTLMPGYTQQSVRDAGGLPVACGLAPKGSAPAFLADRGYTAAAEDLLAASDLRVVVLAAGVALVLNVVFETDTDTG